MSRAKTTMSGPMYLSLPNVPPKPADGCGVCRALVAQRQKARDLGDLSAATDADVEIRDHPHRTRRLR
ncbi:hypothetical protein [Streptomyces sp. NBC_01006]|uniref:hypothetical protein n=1 Tax=Streptomyces sp. NBC_01006 TaxID=2903716 RepID=UPI0038697288|nr:hypothetical protein OG509_16995 [Streptomyces sp. NBC_01006]